MYLLFFSFWSMPAAPERETVAAQAPKSVFPANTQGQESASAEINYSDQGRVEQYQIIPAGPCLSTGYYQIKRSWKRLFLQPFTLVNLLSWVSCARISTFKHRFGGINAWLNGTSLKLHVSARFLLLIQVLNSLKMPVDLQNSRPDIMFLLHVQLRPPSIKFVLHKTSRVWEKVHAAYFSLCEASIYGIRGCGSKPLTCELAVSK